MGRLGSDQTGLPRKRTDRCGVEDTKLEEAGSLDSCVLSIRRISESKGKYVHVVECKYASPLKQSLLAPQRRFHSETLEDPDGRASALRFALTTDSLLAFRSYLFGNPEPPLHGFPLGVGSASTSATVDGSRAVTVTQGSSNARATAYVCVRKNTLFGLWFTVAICRLEDGSLRSISFRNMNTIIEIGIGEVATFLRSAAFKSWVYRVANLALACGGEAGVCRDNGELFAKCKRCGGLEHPQCHGQTVPTDKQAFEDYLCSTCLMVEREEVLAIRLEEQGGGDKNPEGFWSEARSAHMDTAYHACCVCGCEDNDVLDELVPCPCETSPAVVHPSCAAACKDLTSPKVSARRSSLPCLICGGEGVLHNGASDQCKGGNEAASKRPGVGMKRSIKSIQASGKGAKRSRTAATNGTVKVEDLSQDGPMRTTTIKKESTVHSAQVESKDTDSEKSGVALLGRRFSDAPAIVPIKKRRIQMAEVMRTPSPPPRSPSPGIQSPSPRSPSLKSASPPPRSVSPRCLSPPILSPSSTCCSPTTRSPSSPAPPPRSPSPGSPSLPRRTPLPPGSVSMVGDLGPEDGSGTMISSTCSTHAMETAETKEAGMVVHLSSSLPTSPSPSLHHDDKVCKVGDEEEAITTGKECLGAEDVDMVVESSEESFREGSGHSTEGAMDQDVTVEGPQGALLTSTSGCFRDDRLHWDLNTDMAAWEGLTAQAAGMEDEASKVREPACLSASADSDESRHGKKAEEPIEGEVKVRVDEDPETEECVDYGGNSGCRDLDDQEERMSTMLNKSECKAEAAVDNLEVDNSFSREGEAACLKGEAARDNLELEKPLSRDREAAAHEDAEEVQESMRTQSGMQEEHQDDAQHTEAKFEKQATSLRSKATEWDHMPEEAEAEEHVDYGDSDCRDADDMGLEVEERASLALQDDSDWKAEEAIGNLEVDAAASFEGEAVSDAGETQDNSAIQGEDVKASVHENQQPESSLERHDTSRRTKSTGWDKLPEGFHSAEEALRAAKESSSCRGRGGPWASSGGRGSMLNSRGSVIGNRLGTGPGAHRDGFTPRGYNYNVDRSADKLSRGRDGSSHGRRLDDGLNANSYDIGQGRKPGRGGPAAAAGIHGRGRAGRWIDTQAGSLGEWGPGWRRSTTGFGPQGHPNAAAVAAARVKSSGFVVAPDGTITKAGSAMAPSRGGLRSTIGTSRGGRGLLMNFARGPPVDLEAGLNFPIRVGVGTDRGMGNSSNAGMKVGGRGLGPGPGFGGGMSERGGSAGRRMMDRYRGPPFGSGGMDSRRSESPHRSMYPLDHQKMDSRTPPRFRPESRVERSKTPPYHTLNHAKSVAVASARGDHSPPTSSKWSGDRREAHNFRDQDYKRPISRSHMPPSRTSPHVHPSSLMDDWDRQGLEGARHSPPMRVVLNSSVSAGKSGDGSSETRRSKREEDEDARITGSRSKDGDYDRISPRDGDKDRDSRGNVYRRERSTDDDRKRDSKKLSSKDGRSSSGHKHASTREGEDDVAPRRRRPS